MVCVITQAACVSRAATAHAFRRAPRARGCAAAQPLSPPLSLLLLLPPLSLTCRARGCAARRGRKHATRARAGRTGRFFSSTGSLRFAPGRRAARFREPVLVRFRLNRDEFRRVHDEQPAICAGPPPRGRQGRAALNAGSESGRALHNALARLGPGPEVLAAARRPSDRLGLESSARSGCRTLSLSLSLALSLSLTAS